MTRAAWAAAAGIMLVAGVGCYHPAPHTPNYGYPNYQTVPPGGMPAAPGGSYIVPGQTMPSTLGAPATSYPSSGPTLAPPINGGGSSPPSTFEGGVNPQGGVPNYEDPNAGDFGNPPEDGYLPPSSGDGASPFMREGTAIPRQFNQGYASQMENGQRDYFAEIDKVSLDSTTVEVERPSELAAASPKAIQPASFEEASFGPEPGPAKLPSDGGGEGDAFGYERSSYRWLRGVVDFDPAKKDWQIIYGLTPEASDKYGGSLTLLDEGQLSDFQNDDVVLVEGQLDPTAGRDVLGKPLYRVKRAELIGRFE